MANACADGGRLRCPVVARLSGNQRPICLRAGENVVLNRRGRSRPLPVDPSSTLVDEQRGVARAGMQFVEVPGDEHTVGIAPWTGADPAPGVDGLTAVIRIALGAEIRAPRVPACAGGRCQLLAGGVGAAQSTEISRHARRAADKKLIGPVGFDGIVLLSAPQPAASTHTATADHLFAACVKRCFASMIFIALAARSRLPSRSPVRRTMRGTPGGLSRPRGHSRAWR